MPYEVCSAEIVPLDEELFLALADRFPCSLAEIIKAETWTTQS